GVARKFRITEEGHRLLSEQREGIVTGLSSVVADWSPQRLGRFIADLRQFNTDIERITGRPWPRGAEDTDGTADAAGADGMTDTADTDGAAETADDAGPVAPSALSAATADRD
ncbi:MAG: hypothetical protein HOZ81_49935, partial [Streptomyces sp.]|nr:hypothetical protein [Streptomyces sp.]